MTARKSTRTRKIKKESAAAYAQLDDSIRAVLDRVVASFDGETFGTVLPNHIHQIEVSIKIGAARAEIKVTGMLRVPTLDPSAPLRLEGAPESCREALRMTKTHSAGSEDLEEGEKVPDGNEIDISGRIRKKINRADKEFESLVENGNDKIIFKDEEKIGADRMMSSRLRDKLNALADLVEAEWAGVKLRVTEAWDGDNEHTGDSLHYEGRAADLTTYPVDKNKLGRLGRLAVDAGLDWVWYENSAHIHASVTA